MSTHKKLKFLVKRKDTGKIARIEIEENNMVFDLLELSKTVLKFDEEAILSVHQEGDEKEISEALDVSEIAHLKILFIQDNRIDETKELTMEEEDAHGSEGTAAMLDKRNEPSDGQTTQQRLLNKLKIQAVSNEAMKTGNATSTMMGNFETAEYIVLLGDVGSGKSTVVEKITGETGRSSDAFESYTRSAEAFWVPDGSLLVSDAPGSNPIEEELEHNVWIAAAFNYRPVSRVFIVVKAEPRMDTVVDNIGKYANRFLEPAEMDVLGVLITHMDTVKWSVEKFKPAVNKKIGIKTVVFSGIDTTGEVLVNDLLKTCTSRHNLTVDDENFFKFFKLHNNHMKILKSTNEEIKKFTTMKKNFDEAREGFSGKDMVDLVFEFQAYMADEIIKAKQRLSHENNFTFMGDGAANEAGHVANMVNQLRNILYDIRVECVGIQSEHGVSELRKCPYCGLVWTKVEGCDGDTTCGNRPNVVNDMRNSAFSVLGTFAFQWVDDKLNITKSGNKNVKSVKSSSSRYAGCGNTINWSKMATVPVPPEFSETVKVCTSDITMLPPTASGFKKELTNLLDTAKRAMKISNKPTKIKKPKNSV